MREFISLSSIYILLSVSKQSKSETLTPAGFFFNCSKNIESESYPFNKVLSLQHTILNYSYDVEQQISRTSFCTTEILYLWFSSYHFPLCPAPATTALISASMSTRLSQIPHMSGIMQCLTFWDQPSSPSMMSSSFLHFVTYYRIYPLFKAE